MNGRKHFWEVASVSWPDGVVTKIDRYYEEALKQLICKTHLFYLNLIII